MITETLIRKEFIADTVSRGIGEIYSTQEKVIRENFSERTGRLRTSVSVHHFSSSTRGFARSYYVRILPYLRFLDMAYRLRNDRIAKHKRNKLALYNRVVWGVLYHETFPELAYGFTDEVRRQVGGRLKEIFNTDNRTSFKAD